MILFHTLKHAIPSNLYTRLKVSEDILTPILFHLHKNWLSHKEKEKSQEENKIKFKKLWYRV